MNKTIVTVVGRDRVGIIAAICTYLAENNVNIRDLSQTITDSFFNMMMVVDITASPKKFSVLSDEIAALGEELGMQIRMQQEDIFDAMHRI